MKLIITDRKALAQINQTIGTLQRIQHLSKKLLGRELTETAQQAPKRIQELRDLAAELLEVKE